MPCSKFMWQFEICITHKKSQIIHRPRYKSRPNSQSTRIWPEGIFGAIYSVNTEKRRMARSSFDKDFFKLMSNAVYGKTIKQFRNRVNVKLVTDPNKLKKCIQKSTCMCFETTNSDLVMILMTKTKNIDEQADICGNGYITYSRNGRLPISLPLHGVEVFVRSM